MESEVCQDMIRIAWNKRTKGEIKKIVNDLGYELLEEYFEKSLRKVIIKDDCGYKYDVHLSNLIKGQGISIVDKRNSFSLYNISLWLKINNKNFELCDDNIYNGANSRLYFYCFKCKESFIQLWSQISSNQNIGCSICSGHQIGKYNNLRYINPKLSLEWIKSEHNKTPEEVSEFSTEKVYWQCPDCEHKWWATVHNRSMGRDCSRCADERKESLVASECKQYFKDNYNAEPEYKLFKNLKTGYWLLCDIYIPNNIFVEIHGPQHYKSGGFNISSAKRKNISIQQEFEYRQWLDKIKKEYCQNNGLYIEVDLRKIKTTEKAIEYIENILSEVSQ